ncbi:outer membrane protein assembly factor BamB family protein [Sunxiuqinia sp. sy24]|uniref:outer membrane protein assembly factor BamB family protein n=1 Tax=Sunxiuqinia sp. sy24 TaxID=3461495 RepID=UPI00404560A2
MRKLIIPILLILVLIAGAAFILMESQSKSYNDNSAFRAIPVKTPLIIEVPELDALLDKMDPTSPLVAELQQFRELDAFFADIKELKNQFETNAPFRKVLAGKSALVAFNAEGKNNVGCLFVASLNDRKEKATIHDYFNSLPTAKSGKISSREYDQEQIYQLKTGKTTLNFAFKDGVLLLSRYALFVEEAIRQMTVENLTHNQQLQDLYATVSSNSDFNLYIQHNRLPGLISKLAPRAFRKQLQLFGSFSDWTELDVNIKNTELLLNGFSFSNQNNHNYLSALRGQKPIRSGITKAISANTCLFINLALDDLNTFYINYEEYLKKQGLFYARETQLKKIERYSKVPFQKLFTEIAKNEFALTFGTVTQNDPANNRFFIAEVKGQSLAREKLLPVLENYAKANKKTLSEIQSEYKIQNAHSFSIYEFPFVNLPELLFGEVFSGTESHFLSFYDNYLIFADNSTALKNYLHNLVLSETLENDIQFQKFSEQLASRSTLNSYLNFSKAFYLGNYYLNEEAAQSLTDNEQSIRKFHALSWQFSENSGQFLNNLYLKYDPVLKEEPQTVWQSKLESTVAIKPQLVTNHTDKANKEVIIQDNKNQLYLINKEGVSLWKVQLPGKIMSEIFQIDYYKNGKLQYLFNTKNKLHIIDREGNNVARYPINLRAPATNGVAVFDYDNNRNYRFFVASDNKQIYAYNHEGKLVKGWDFKGTDGLVTNPIKHFRVGAKDYLVCADQYKTYILDRRGNTRVKTAANFEHSGNDLFLVQAGQAAIATTDVNGLVHLQYFNGEHKAIETEKFGKDHFFEAADLNADGKTDFIFADGNQLWVLNDRGEEILKREFNSPISSKPNSYTFANNDRKIGVVCQAENRVYLVNSDGSLYEGFPLHGNTDFTIGYFNSSNSYFNLVVGNQDNSFYNYQVE